ncbi:MAG: TonB-dependent receptor [Crocinitomicaceae bacterium]|nr:TonB-dependent receptor [Crocinitomicaceae bacterium]|tara:strand:- start:11393 stop:13714 length:2322 start_codon:yes stop_codon:yes gene_type:complete
MDRKITVLCLLFLLVIWELHAQIGTVKGVVKSNGEGIEFVQVRIDSTTYGAITNSQGKFTIKNVPYGKHKITASFVGYTRVQKELILSKTQPEAQLNFELTETIMELEHIVITATKTPKRQTDSPVIVNVINSQTLDNVQACNLSEGLKFQPGLRVETDCQTCNYTQLRMNGLAGGYSQILVNGRPIFSPLTGLYGMEQLPTSMIDRIEVVRGGGSSLYGSSAIGGTVNVITKIPKKKGYELNYTYQNIDGQTNDNTISGNATLVSKSKKSGISFFLNHRNRDFYDANGDNFSEIPKIKNTAFGTSMFLLPRENQKLELSISYIDEYRFGGEMITNQPAYVAKQSEERTHRVWMASADYQINFNNDNSSLISYLAWQNTDRDHYTGILPDEGTVEYARFMENPPYGTSLVSTYNLGLQVNHKLNNFLGGKNVLTLGTEYLYDDVLDEIAAYRYLIDQTTTDYGLFLQSDWEIIKDLTLLSGVRMDIHNLVDQPVFSPRISLMYKLKKNTQFRVNYGTGFRAPQAFDTDLHIAFSGGGVSRISLSPDLKPERSQSLSASINYDKPMQKWIAGYTIEGFHNRLQDAFYLQPLGEDQFGERFEKQNGDGATVQGITLELRANYNRLIQLESGFTIQSSTFDSPVEYINGVDGIREFTRTPNDYGYAILTYTPNKKISATLNYVYTGTMRVPHFAGAPNQTVDEIVTTKAFSELGVKMGYTFPIKSLGNGIEVYGGVKNIFNAYQDDFDIGKNRDSNYIYGPAQPRTFFAGIKLKLI